MATLTAPLQGEKEEEWQAPAAARCYREVRRPCRTRHAGGCILVIIGALTTRPGLWTILYTDNKEPAGYSLRTSKKHSNGRRTEETDIGRTGDVTRICFQCCFRCYQGFSMSASLFGDARYKKCLISKSPGFVFDVASRCYQVFSPVRSKPRP